MGTEKQPMIHNNSHTKKGTEKFDSKKLGDPDFKVKERREGKKSKNRESP